VCKLKKTVYGLKQSPRAWFDKFRVSSLKWDFRTLLIILSSSAGLLITSILVVYVDIILTGSDCDSTEKAKEYLKTQFVTKNMTGKSIFLRFKLLPVNKE